MATERRRGSGKVAEGRECVSRAGHNRDQYGGGNFAEDREHGIPVALYDAHPTFFGGER